MRKRRICYVGALGLALAVAIPGSAMGQDVQNIEGGFQPQFNANVVFGQPASLSSKPSKAGTLRINTFLSGTGPAPSLQRADIHLPSELEINGKGLPQCDPTDIAGLAAADARAACSTSLVGTGLATILDVNVQGDSALFNGANNTILVHISVGAAPPVTLIGQLKDSRLGPPYGQVLEVPVNPPAGPVPPGITVQRTELTTISKKFKDPTVQKQIKKAKKKGNKKKAKQLKKKLNKTFVTASCGADGTLSYRADFIHAPPDPVQSPTFEQPCTS
jgi:hypothetical protein